MVKLFLFVQSCVCSVFITTYAHAQTSTSTLGQTLANFISNVWQPFFLLVATLSAIAGIFLLIRALFRIIEVSRQPFGFEGLSSAIISLISGILLLVLPDLAGIGMLTVLGDVQGGNSLGGNALDYNDRIGYQGDFINQIFGGITNVGAVESCINLNENYSSNSTNAIGCMVRNLAVNVIPIAVFLLFSITFIIGFTGLAVNIIGLIKATQRQARISSILTSMLFNVLLMNIPFLFRTVGNTIIAPTDSVISGNAINTSSSLLSWTATDTNYQVWCNLFSQLIIILLFFGIFAFVRGVYMLKVLSETGRQGGTYSMASVYMIAGLLLANLKTVMLILSGTLGISGQLFCS